MGLTKAARQKAITITSGYEGILAGNFDGMYLSYGIIQWNFGKGTLQPLLNKLFQRYPNIAESILPNKGNDLKNALTNGTEKTWALSIQKNNKVVDPWKSALYKLYYTSEMMEIMYEHMEWYITKAINMCTAFNMKKEQDFALAFDLAVQNGGLKYYKMTATSDYDKRVSWVQTAVNKTTGKINGSNERCKLDVKNRKMAIVTGGPYGTKGFPAGLKFDDISAFEADYVDWKTILNKVSSSYELWEIAITAICKMCEAAGNIGVLEIFTNLPTLIEKIFNKRDASNKEWSTIIQERTDSPEKWLSAINIIVSAAEYDGSLGDLEVFKYLKKLIERLNSFPI